jgi:hypothetical protein
MNSTVDHPKVCAIKPIATRLVNAGLGKFVPALLPIRGPLGLDPARVRIV